MYKVQVYNDIMRSKELIGIVMVCAFLISYLHIPQYLPNNHLYSVTFILMIICIPKLYVFPVVILNFGAKIWLAYLFFLEAIYA